MEFEKIYKNVSDETKSEIINECARLTRDNLFEHSFKEFTVKDYKEFINNFATNFKYLSLKWKIDLQNILPLLEPLFDDVKCIIIIDKPIVVTKINNIRNSGVNCVIDLELVRSKILEIKNKSYNPYFVVIVFIIGFITGYLLRNIQK